MMKKYLVIFTVMLAILTVGCGTSKQKNKETTELPAKKYVTVTEKNAEVTLNFVDIKGSVKNTSNEKEIGYVVLRYETLSEEGEVLDSQQIPIFGPIRPNESKMFTSIAPWPKKGTKYTIKVDDARYGTY